MDDVVSIRWSPEGECTVDLRSAVFNLPLANWKKLIRRMATHPEANKAAETAMRTWFTREMFNPSSQFRATKKMSNKLYKTYRSLIFKGEI